MAKKPRPMTSAERVRKHRAAKTTKQQINLTLPTQSVAKLDRQAKRAGQTRSEFVDTLIASINAKAPATPLDRGNVKPATVTSNVKKKPPSKKKKSPSITRSRDAAQTPRDAIGLTRPETFKDFPGAVSVAAEIKDFPTMDKAGRRQVKWQSKPRKFMAVWEAQKYIDTFRKTHSEASIKQRYMVEDKSIMEMTATYGDERSDHRVVYQARNR